MKRLLIPTLLLPLAALVAVGAVMIPIRTKDARPGQKAALAGATKRSKRDPVDTLVAQLHRRFSDTRDIDFGYSRISRPNVRMHGGPTMELNIVAYADGETPPQLNKKFVRRDSHGTIVVQAEDGSWISYDEARDQMRPENPTELGAINGLIAAKREIAIYTFGSFVDGKTNRIHGPAYLRQKGPIAPDGENVKGAAETAWRGGQPVLAGFRVRAEKVFAKASCVKCHNDPSENEGMPQSHPKVYKKGDALGLILIAEKI